MLKKVLQTLAMVLAAYPAVGLAQAPKDGVYISDEDVKAVLKHALDTKRTNPDNTIRVIDMGSYQLSVAVIHRGAMGGGRAANANTGGGAGDAVRDAAANPSPTCGEQRNDARADRLVGRVALADDHARRHLELCRTSCRAARAHSHS